MFINKMSNKSMHSSNNEHKMSDFTPREYQVEILERAVKENVIVHLPTGSGKTFIAVMLIKTYIHQLKKYSEGGKRIFFLVNTTPLVRQQAEAIRNLSPLQVGEYSGEMGVDFWDKNKWLEEQDQFQVLVMTTQIYLDMILHDFTNLKQACLLIFDECHHAVRNHPMRQVMSELDKVIFDTKPKILGLTATLLNANVKFDKVRTEIETLETTFHARVVRALNDEMVLQYSTCPNEQVCFYEEEEPFLFSKMIEEFVNKIIKLIKLVDLPDIVQMPDEQPVNGILLNEFECKPLKRVERALKDVQKISNELGLFAADVSLLSIVILIERLKVVYHDTLFRILCSVETGIHHLRKKISVFMKDVEPNSKSLIFATQKVLKLVGILKHFPDENRAIIFVDRRSTAQALHQIFVALRSNTEFKNIKSEFIVGVNQIADSVSRENLLNRRKNNAIMKKFNSGELNVLFASNVIEEGVDVRACNLVIKFDMPTTFRSYTQSKGRARNINSTYIVIAASPKTNEQSVLDCFKKFQCIEHTLKSILCEERMSPDNEDLGDDDDAIYEFINPSGSKVTALSAISLVNRYCAMLPQDKFSRLTAFWWVKEVIESGKKAFIGYVKLPINTPLKNIVEGLPRKTKLSAKRLVALEVCKKLYEKGEFDSQFVPVGRKTNLLFDSTIFPKWNEEDFNPKDNKNIRKNKRFFDKHYTRWECFCKPLAGLDVFMHIIKITPTYPYPDTDRLQTFYNLLLSDATLCVLTTCPWPELPNFPLYMNVGEIKVEVLQNYSVLQLTEEQTIQLQHFHKLLFTDALPLLKMYTVENNKKCNIDEYMIAPVMYANNMFSIDWSTIQNQGKFPDIKPKPFGKRLDEPVTEDRYHMKVVIPWYRSEDFNLKYVVTKVRLDQNPDSDFPSQNFKSYADYFSNRYNQKIYDKTQPLLEVRAISSKINCLLPRSQGGSSKKQKKEDDAFEETLVPELCYLISFPACYLLKVTLLPSALHRVHHLLLAEELRQTIAENTNLGSLQLPHDAKWRELQLDKQTKWDDESPSAPDVLDILTAPRVFHINDDDSLILDSDEQEPADIDRKLDVDITAVLHYNNFVNKSVKTVKVSTIKTILEYKNLHHKTVEPLKIFKGTYEGYGPEIVDILTALTSTGSNDIINYERAELLGDSFLKFAASLALFTFFPHLDEGKLSQVKGKIVGNRNLFFCGLAINLPGYLKVNTFEYIDWKVPGFSLSPKLKPYDKDPIKCSSILDKLPLTELGIAGEELPDLLSNVLSESHLGSLCKDENNENSDNSSDDESTGFRKVQPNFVKSEYLMKHLIPEKLVSDSVEALLSVYVQNFGIEGGFKFLQWMSVLPDSMCNIDVLLYSEPASPLLSSNTFDCTHLLPNIEDLESSLGYTFRNKAFLVQALTHSSYPHNVTDCYQRLEFLGDAILDFVLTAYIFEECKDMNPGELTDLRSALVNNVTFACVAVRHRFHTHLLARACKLTDIISKFVKHQIGRNHEVGPQVFYLIEETDVKVAESIDVPKALGDIFEALIAAIYLDSGRDLNQVWRVVYNIMENEIALFSKDIPKNSIRLMYEKFAAFPPKFGKAEVKGDSVVMPLEVIHDGKQEVFHGFGKNKYFAKLAAAKHALNFFEM